MFDIEAIKNSPVAVLGGGNVGKTCAADCVISGKNKDVRIFELPQFYDRTLKSVEKSGITLGGIQKNQYGYKRFGKAYFNMLTSNMAEALDGAKLIIVAIPSVAHDIFFEQLVPLLEDGMVIHIIPDNYGSLKLRKKMRELGCDKRVIIGGWCSAPYGTRVEKEGGVPTSDMWLVYRAKTLRGATLPSTDQEFFLETSKYLGCFDSITDGDGAFGGDTVMDIGFSNVNPVLHCPGTILGVGVMENYGRIYGGNDPYQYSIYSHAYCPSISEVQYAFYLEELQLSEAMGIGMATYPKETFFQRTSILGPEYMGDDCFVPFDQQWETGFKTGPFTIQDRYVTEDVPVGCHLYHELGKKFGIATPVIDSMITLGSVMTGKDFYATGMTLEDLDLAHMDRDQILDYLRNGNFTAK